MNVLPYYSLRDEALKRIVELKLGRLKKMLLQKQQDDPGHIPRRR
jgi:ATP-dependent Clp protease ATP-binding subunit ClpA